jgi:hypothetical protein
LGEFAHVKTQHIKDKSGASVSLTEVLDDPGKWTAAHFFFCDVDGAAGIPLTPAVWW